VGSGPSSWPYSLKSLEKPSEKGTSKAHCVGVAAIRRSIEAFWVALKANYRRLRAFSDGFGRCVLGKSICRVVHRSDCSGQVQRHDSHFPLKPNYNI
jgi:hypothetical protein